MIIYQTDYINRICCIDHDEIFVKYEAKVKEPSSLII